MRKIIFGVSFCLILVSGWMALTVAAAEPVERNIVYVHVPASICALLCFCGIFVCSIQYLRTAGPGWDRTAAACGEVGFIFATVLNLTGMIFARTEWGIWWTASMRLVSSAILWFLYVAYLILRASFEAGQGKGKVAAVFGIIAAVDVPFVLCGTVGRLVFSGGVIDVLFGFGVFGGVGGLFRVSFLPGQAGWGTAAADRGERKTMNNE